MKPLLFNVTIMQKLFGEHLKETRQGQDLTVQALATACGVSRSYVTLIETGKRLPGKRLIPKIATALQLNTAETLNWYLEDIRQRVEQANIN